MYEEGKVKIKYSKIAFLNPKAEFLRDISVAYLNSIDQRYENLLDSTAATGIRGIRYSSEAKVKKITFLDINASAFSELNKNVKFNKLKNAKVINTSIQEFANSESEKFDIIDLDPFGGVSPYIFDLLKLCRDSTRLLITATDTAVLCGAHQKACLRLYLAKPMHNELCHEVGLRILIGYIASLAAQFEFGIETELSVMHGTYARVFLKLNKGSEAALNSIGDLGYAYYCEKCGNRFIKKEFLSSGEKCKFCDYKMLAAGKIWAGELKNKKLSEKIFKEISKANYSKESSKIMEKINAEVDLPLYYSIPDETKRLHMESVSPAIVMKKLEKLGYSASTTHLHDSSIKTEADIKTIQKILKLKK